MGSGNYQDGQDVCRDDRGGGDHGGGDGGDLHFDRLMFWDFVSSGAAREG